jgi:ketosteroid isomerase-like protein
MEHSAAVDLLAELHAAQNAFYAGGDDSRLRLLLSPEVIWTIPGRNAIAGTYRGLDQVLGYFDRRRQIANGTFRLRNRNVLVGEQGPEIAALTDGEALLRGRERRWSTVGLYEVRTGRIARCWLLPLDPAEFDDIWSGPG